MKKIVSFLGVLFINQAKDHAEIEKYINTYVDETKLLQNVDYFHELQNEIKNNTELQKKIKMLEFENEDIKEKLKNDNK